MDASGRRFQFNLKWLMLQTSLLGLTLALFLDATGENASDWSFFEMLAVLTLTGAIIGGCFRNFWMGTIIGLLQSLIVWGTIIYVGRL